MRAERGGEQVSVDSVVDEKAAESDWPARLTSELEQVREGLPARLDGICRSRSQREAIAERSYWHPNGFVKLVIEDDPGAGQLRFHVWPREVDDDDVHAHAWWYESVVLEGELQEVVYCEAPLGEGMAMWRHSYGQTGHRRFAFVDPERVGLVRQGAPIVRRAGDRHGGPPDHVHRFGAAAAPAVTLLRVGRILRRSSPVYRAGPESLPMMTPRPTSLGDVTQWLGHVRDVIDRPASV